ncbi:hypothetical protein EUX98_g5520 [Antrodiella citrinella]|uniref:cellulose 1,4-beta-cellobiosidase (non-reducing end) n=1 Tax=Antrodiella citrinella TaxID=2447956 RepID=A0A4S4MR95_9APHY|nr:hypothetical protein EUX98_g5520 [Antrodiella citrinella]
MILCSSIYFTGCNHAHNSAAAVAGRLAPPVELAPTKPGRSFSTPTGAGSIPHQLDEADYTGTYGVTATGDSLKLNFVTNGADKNVGSRVYLMESDTNYHIFNLLNQEFTFDVDVSKLPCGLNGALYFSDMAADGGMSKYPSNKAAYTPHPCTTTGVEACTGDACNGGTAGLCDPAGCDFNSFRMGDQTFFGAGKTVNCSRPSTVVTQFLTNDNTTTGTLSEIRCVYVQDGNVIQNSKVNIPGMDALDSISTEFCTEKKAVFSDDDTFGGHGGLTAMGQAFGRGMVLVLSIWDDYAANMLWLDWDYPTDHPETATTSGVPSDVESSAANAYVVYSNIKTGPIGWLVRATPAAPVGRLVPPAVPLRQLLKLRRPIPDVGRVVATSKMMKKRWGLPFGPVQSGSQTNTAPPLDLPPIITPADAKQFGFENFGNTCYANSVLQALYFCGPFRELVIQYPDPSVPELSTHPPPPVQQTPTPLSPRPKPTRKMSVSDSPHVSSPVQRPTPAPPSASIPGSIPIPPAPPTLLSALRSLYVHISKNPADRGTVSPKAFMDKLKEMNELFRGTQHQDAHEFLNVLLNTIVEEMETDRRNGAGEDLSQSIATLSSNAPTTNGSTNESHRPLVGTLVHRLFEGVLTSETRCLTCETVSSRDESFLDLSIDIEQNSSVTACLRQFSASEMLCQKNKFFCDSCCDLQEAEKRMKIKKLPNVLALHLKRFKYQEDTGRYIKLTYRVAFPYHLRLFNTVDDAEDPDRLYELFAIVVHIGAGPHHGHYVSIINTRDMWLLFDDDTVEVIKESDIPRYFGDSGSNNGSAYVLYYQAVDVDVAALGVKIVQPPSSGASGVTTTHENGTAPSSISFLAKADQVPPDVLTDSLQSLEPDHIVPTLPPGLSVEPPSPTPFDSSVPTFTTPSYTATSSTLSTPGASTTGLTPLVIPNGNSSSSSSSGSGSGVGLGLAVPTGNALPESATSTPTSTSPPQAGASTLGSIMNSLTLKHVSSSVRVKNGSGRKDEGALPPMPASPVASTSSSAGLGGKPRSSTTRPHSPTTESVESSAYSHVNGKEKDREEKEREKEKSIKWFPRRKSFRNSRPSTSAGPATAPPLPPPPSAFNTFPTSKSLNMV